MNLSRSASLAVLVLVLGLATLIACQLLPGDTEGIETLGGILALLGSVGCVLCFVFED